MGQRNCPGPCSCLAHTHEKVVPRSYYYICVYTILDQCRRSHQLSYGGDGHETCSTYGPGGRVLFSVLVGLVCSPASGVALVMAIYGNWDVSRPNKNPRLA